MVVIVIYFDKIGKFVPDTFPLSQKRHQEECGCKRHTWIKLFWGSCPLKGPPMMGSWGPPIFCSSLFLHQNILLYVVGVAWVPSPRVNKFGIKSCCIVAFDSPSQKIMLFMAGGGVGLGWVSPPESQEIF